MAEGTRVASAYVEIGMASGGIAPGIEAAKQQMVQGVGNAVGAMSTIIAGGTYSIFQSIANGMMAFVNSVMDAEQTSAKFNYMMDQMSPRLGFSTSQLKDMASSMAALTNQSGGAAKSVMSTLGMFDMVSGENFRLATQYSLQFANTGLASAEGAAHKLGIALTNPIAGLRLLRSMEIMFTMDQQNMIKRMVQMGDMAGAQRMLLEGIGKTLPGLSAAMAGTTTAILAKMERDVKSIGKAIGEAILPVLGIVAQSVSYTVEVIKGAWAGMPESFKEIAKSIIMIASLFVSFNTVIPYLASMKAFLAPIGSALMMLTGPWGIVIALVGAFVAALAGAFKDERFATPMKTALMEVWEIIKDIGSALVAGFGGVDIREVWDWFKENAASAFFAVTNFIEDNKETLTKWGYDIAGIARAAFNNIIENARIIWGALGSLSSWFMTENSLDWDNIRDTITSSLTYIRVLTEESPTTYMTAWASIKYTILSTWDTISNFLGAGMLMSVAGWSAVIEMIRILSGRMLANFGVLIDAIGEAFNGLWDGIASSFEMVMSGNFDGLADNLANSVNRGLDRARNRMAAMAGMEEIVNQAREAGRLTANQYNQEIDRIRNSRSQSAIEAEAELNELSNRLGNRIGRENIPRPRQRNELPPAPNQGGGQEQVSTLFVEFKSTGLVDMWKQTQQSLTGKLEGLAATHINVAREQLAVLGEIRDRPPVVAAGPARAG